MDSRVSRKILTSQLLCTILLLVNNAVSEDKEINYIYLNSNANCGHDRTFPVGPQNVYLVRPNAYPTLRTHIFRKCDVTFHSNSKDGHVCVIEEGDGAKISDNNIELKVYDGLGNKEDDILGHLKPYPKKWPKRDVCSKQRYVTFHLSEINEETSSDIRKVDIAFKVVDITSRERTLYLDGTYCDSHYDLFNSEISIFNQPRSSDSSVMLECAMRFDKVDKNSDSSICIAFIPSPHLKCSNEWRFVVSTADFNVEEKFIVYSRSCSDPESKKLHVKCFKHEHALVTVVLLRQKLTGSNSSYDQPGDFQIKVRDYKGTEESFLEEVKSSMEESDSPSLGLMEIILICVCTALVLIIILIICCNRKKLPCYKYTVVEKKEPSNENNEL